MTQTNLTPENPGRSLCGKDDAVGERMCEIANERRRFPDDHLRAPPDERRNPALGDEGRASETGPAR